MLKKWADIIAAVGRLCLSPGGIFFMDLSAVVVLAYFSIVLHKAQNDKAFQWLMICVSILFVFSAVTGTVNFLWRTRSGRELEGSVSAEPSRSRRSRASNKSVTGKASKGGKTKNSKGK